MLNFLLMNLDYFTALLIKYHVAFYYAALGLNLAFFRKGASLVFLTFISFFWLASIGLSLALDLDKFFWFVY